MKCECCVPAIEGTAAQLKGHRIRDDCDPEDIVVHDDPPKRFPRVAAEPVERKTKVTWCVGGKEVLHDRGDGTYEVARWPHASIEDLERLFYVIGELLTITQPEPQS